MTENNHTTDNNKLQEQKSHKYNKLFEKETAKCHLEESWFSDL